MRTETIAAIATALTNAGISIIRMSGPDSGRIIDKIYFSKNGKKVLSRMPSHTVHYGYIRDGESIVDEVMVLIMKGPNSYTKEDVIEIDCHGGVIVTKRILELLLKNGARAAEPGEFTKRAFLNGRIDLTQAEAVADMIDAKNNYALRSSVNQLTGSIKKAITKIRQKVIEDIAFIEAALDDPEHIEIEGFREVLEAHIGQYQEDIEKLLKTADNGRLLREGLKTVIVGKPNAGKSSLLNNLIGDEKAIVTNIAGTTRDILEETIRLDDIILNVADTAGIRETNDKIEKIGVEKARKWIAEADLILYVVDASVGFDENDNDILESIKEKKTIVLLNKSDLPMMIQQQQVEERIKSPVIYASMKEQKGIAELEKTIKEMFFHGDISYNNEVIITNVRQKEALLKALEGLNKVEESINNNMPEDFYSIDLMEVYESLGFIIGESVDEDLVNTIFSKFCMGK